MCTFYCKLGIFAVPYISIYWLTQSYYVYSGMYTYTLAVKTVTSTSLTAVANICTVRHLKVRFEIYNISKSDTMLIRDVGTVRKCKDYFKWYSTVTSIAACVLCVLFTVDLVYCWTIYISHISIYWLTQSYYFYSGMYTFTLAVKTVTSTSLTAVVNICTVRLLKVRFVL